ncbi:MAG: hypothetical protein ACKOXB_05975 [Flavobacteriales bacterium]
MLSFAAKQENKVVKTEWQTASEINADYFVVERSIDGLLYDFLGDVPASGNSSTLKNYEFMDSLAYPGVNYYRLKQFLFRSTQVELMSCN